MTGAIAQTDLAITPRRPGLGAWVDGVDLATSDLAPLAGRLRDAWLEHQVLFFRDQSVLPPARHGELAGVFGSGRALPNPNLAAAGDLVERIVNDEDTPPFADRWHADLSYRPRPPAGTIIQIQELPPVGGDTLWLSATLAYEALSAGMRAYLDGLEAVHSWEARIHEQRRYRRDEAGLAAYSERVREQPPVRHPVACVHPVTGRRAIFVNETFTTHVDEVHPIESDGLLRLLFAWLRRPEFQLQHTWEHNQVAVWDNLAVQHYALGDYWPSRRVNQRVVIADY